MRCVVLATIALVSHANGACTHQKWNMPSQTAEGEGTNVMHVSGAKVGNMTIPPTNSSTQSSLFQSFDFESMNMVTRQNLDTMTPGPQGTVHVKSEVGAILNWKAGLMTHRMKFTNPFDGKTQDNCTTVKLPFFLRFLPVGHITEKLKDLGASFVKCVGHHDDLDSFALNLKSPPQWVPEIMRSKFPDVNLSSAFDVDAAGLVKSFKMVEEVGVDNKITIDGKTETWHSSGHFEHGMSFNKVRLGGPSKEDLEVPEEWGDCSTKHMPELEDLLAEWERPDSPFLGHTRVIPYALRALMTEAKASTVVV